MKATYKISESNYPEMLPIGAKVALSNNGSDEIRVLGIDTVETLARLFNTSITFHANDEETSIELDGYIYLSTTHARPVNIVLDPCCTY